VAFRGGGRGKHVKTGDCSMVGLLRLLRGCWREFQASDGGGSRWWSGRSGGLMWWWLVVNGGSGEVFEWESMRVVIWVAWDSYG